MNIKKFNNWKKWIEKQENKDGAEFVFNYWLKVRNQFKNIEIDFSKNINDLFVCIKREYSENKINKFEIELFDNFGITLDKNNYENLKKEISNEDIKLKEIIKMLKSAFHYNSIYNQSDRIVYLFEIIKKMNNYSLYKNLNDIENVLKVKTKKYKIIDNCLILKVEDVNIMETFSSPSWCTNFRREFQEKYINEYDVYYVFEEVNNSLYLYGFNYIKGEKILYNVFDQYNNNIINNKIKILYNKITKEEDKSIIIDRINKIKDIRIEEKILLMISNFVNEEIIENEINNFGNNILFFYEFLSIIEKYNDFYFLNNIINYLEKINKLYNIVIILINIKTNLSKLDKIIIDRYFTIDKNDKLLYTYLSKIDIISKENFNKHRLQIVETDLSFFYYNFLNSDEKKILHFNLYRYLNNDYKKDIINHIIKKNEKSLIRKIINDKRIKNISLFEKIIKNYNIDEIISIKEKEDLLIKLNFMNERNSFFVNYYNKNNKINKKRIINEKIKNKTFSLLFMFLTSNKTYNYKELLKIIKNNNYEIENDKIFDLKILKFDKKNEPYVYYKYIKILKYSNDFIDIIKNNINCFDKKQKEEILKEIKNEKFLIFFIKKNKHKMLNPLSFLNNKIIEIFNDNAVLVVGNVENKK